MDKIFATVDSVFERAEIRFGRLFISIITGIFLLLIAAVLSSVRMETFYHGNGFTRLSLHPFEMEGENDLRFRILSPLMGYLVFMRGPAFKYFMLIVLGAFFGLVYFFKRKEAYRPSESLGVTLLLVFSTLAFYQLFFPAYTDPTSFLLILLFMMFYRKRIASLILIILMLFNHENTIFLFPFFFLLMMNGNWNGKNLKAVLFMFIIAFIPYIIYRKLIAAHAEVNFTFSYYFDAGNMKWTKEHVLPHLAQGVFQSFRLGWIIFLLAFAIDLYEKRLKEILMMSVVIVFVFSQLTIAWDISRLVGFSFPVILISANRLREFFGTKKFLAIIYSVFILNFFIPSYCIGALDPIPYGTNWLR
jgi:hypothetical protein